MQSIFCGIGAWEQTQQLMSIFRSIRRENLYRMISMEGFEKELHISQKAVLQQFNAITAPKIHIVLKTRR